MSCEFLCKIHGPLSWLKFIYSEKATKFCKIFTVLLSYVVPVKSKVKISQNFVAFSEYMNFNVKGPPGKTYLVTNFFRPCFPCCSFSAILRNPYSQMSNNLFKTVFSLSHLLRHIEKRYYAKSLQLISKIKFIF